MSEKIKNRRRTLSRIIKSLFFLLILLIVVIAAVGTNFEPLSDFVSESLAAPTLTYTPSVSEMKTLFKVWPNSTINIRSCPNKTCNRLGQARRNDILEVVAQKQVSDGAWYEIKYGDRTAYIAGWLTTHIPTPTRFPASHPRVAYTLSTPGNLQTTVTNSEDIIVEWQEPRWRPRKPSNSSAISYAYEVTILDSTGSSKTRTSRRAITFTNLKKYANKRLRFRVEAVAEINIDGHTYQFRSKAAEGAALYVPAYDYMLERDETDSRLPGYCSIALALSRGRGYDLTVAYYGRTYQWYRVDVFGLDGKELDIYATRLSGSGDSRANYQRYSDTTFKPGLYTARAVELDPRRSKTFAFLLDEEGDYFLQIGGWGC